MGNNAAVDRKMLNAATTGSATYIPRLYPGFVGGGTDTKPTTGFAHNQQAFHHYISWASGVTAGTVIIETSDSTDGTYSGTWAPIATVANNGSGNAYEDYVETTGQPKAVRHRITVTISGGASPSVSSRLVGTSA